VAAFLFGGPLADAVGRFKAGQIPEFPEVVAPFFAAAINRLIREDPGAPPFDLALAVPPDPRRLARRGFDPGTLVARAALRRLGLRPTHGLLVSGPRPRTQRELPRAVRLRALHDLFRLVPGAGRRLRDRHVLLLDDIRTTGATVSACSRVLRDGGAASVRVATLALVE
jgi:predicted amidophosphoribosyltransferase